MKPACIFCGSLEVGVGASTDVVALEGEPEVAFRMICKQCGAAGPKAKTQEDAVSKFATRYGLVQDIVRAMREVFDLDPLVFSDLVTTRHACSVDLANDEHAVVVPIGAGVHEVGLIGWINGVVGRLCGGLRVATVGKKGGSVIEGIIPISIREDGKSIPVE